MGIGGIDTNYAGYLTPLMNPGIAAYQAGAAVPGATGADALSGVEKKPIVNPGESEEVKPGKSVSPAECETCKERKYQDGSDEMVSFKTAQHISPEAAASRVRAHEQEHVSNAYKEASMEDGKVLQASVSIKMAVCPECGRSYVAGGETATKIQYHDDRFSQNRKSAEADATRGQHIDLAV